MSPQISSYKNNTGHQIIFSDWGNEDGRPIVCVHGLTGNGMDFDEIAPHLVQEGYRVIAPDLLGRGRSDFLDDPLEYNYDTYLADLRGLISHLGLDEVDWLGVSLGGLLGMRIAAEEDSLIARMILIDVGPEVPKEALDFIYEVIKEPYYFESVEALEARMRETRGLTWGPITDAQWAEMAKNNARKLPDGRITYGYDPEIARVFEDEPIGAVDIWDCWDKISCRLLVVHGGQSVLLTEQILEQMRGRGPRFDYVIFKECGHVPSLMSPNQIQEVLHWLKNQLA